MVSAFFVSCFFQHIFVGLISYFRSSSNGKIVAQTKRYKVHDGTNECSVGDIVLISETRPLSKTKRWELKAIKQKSLKLDNQVLGE